MFKNVIFYTVFGIRNWPAFHKCSVMSLAWPFRILNFHVDIRLFCFCVVFPIFDVCDLSKSICTPKRSILNCQENQTSCIWLRVWALMCLRMWTYHHKCGHSAQCAQKAHDSEWTAWGPNPAQHESVEYELTETRIGWARKKYNLATYQSHFDMYKKGPSNIRCIWQ